MTAQTPSSSDASIRSGVSFECMNAAAMRPATPRRSALIVRLPCDCANGPHRTAVGQAWRWIHHNQVAVGDARKRLDLAGGGGARRDGAQPRDVVGVDGEDERELPAAHERRLRVLVSACGSTPLKRARPKLPDRTSAPSGRSIFTTNACDAGSSRAISATRRGGPCRRGRGLDVVAEADLDRLADLHPGGA